MSKSRHSENGFYGVMINVLSFVYLTGYALFESSPTLSRLSLITALALWCVLALRFVHTGRLVIPRLLWAPLGFGVVVVASILWAPYLPLAWTYGSITLSAIFGAIALWLALHNGLSYRTIFWAALAGSAMVIVAAIQNPEQMVDVVARSGGTFSNPNLAAVYLASCAFIVASPPPKSVRVSVFNIALAAGLIGTAIIFTGSRKTLFAVAIFAVYAIVVLIRQSRRRYLAGMLLLGGLVLIIAAVLVWPSANLSSESVSGVGTIQRMLMLREGGEHSSDIRHAMIATGIDLWLKKPWFGYGFGQYARIAPYGTYSHCNYTELLSNTGLLGTLAYYLFPLMIGVYAIKLKRPQHVAALAIVGLSLLTDLASVSILARPNWNMLVLAAFFVESSRPNVFLMLRRKAIPLNDLWLNSRMIRGAIKRVRQPVELADVRGNPELRRRVVGTGSLRRLRRRGDE
ncbi:MAG: O-antigen ligase family protein [Armatimonadota bacterium]|nr:O-antigen ligase family protein [bacterium]